MSLILRTFKPRQILHIPKVLSATKGDGIRKGHWFPDYIPGPYPKTKEEREQAAKKYNLLPEEYDTFPEDDQSCGDYPKLPENSVDSRDPWYPWDYPELRKDYNEPVPYKVVQLLPESRSTDPKSAQNYYHGPRIFFQYITCIFLMIYLLSKTIRIVPVSERQYPTPGVVHYTFDLSKEKFKKARDPACDED